MPMASKFNEVIAIDLKSWGSKIFLVIVDVATRLARGHPGVQKNKDNNADNAGVEDGDETVPIEESDDESGKTGSVETESTGEVAESSGSVLTIAKWVS
ncbi:hypothetical protein Pcinc_006309 [Petrolisthes cinctipes]|uniref:Uncharacterized protein n=1 Tax=Petrolisthes cinctipes TaxID=88211 RepID=A0AAE1GDH1_PETCI|nr:hypothetical protein Pcinc_006309 [Petrolisthes cinctipes]